MTRSAFHEKLIEQARADGWESADRWKLAFAEACRTRPAWNGEYFAGGTEKSEIRESIEDFWPRPDAWRLVTEDRTTHGRNWNYPVLIMEFLEIEIAHRISADKQAAYRELWEACDMSSSFYCRVYHMDRFGVVRPYITEDAMYQLISGMDPKDK